MVLKSDRLLPPDQQTTFRIRSLSSRARSLFQNAAATMNDRNQVVPQLGMAIYAAVQFGVSGWDNLKDASGNIIEATHTMFDGQAALTDESMDAVAPFIQELADAVIAHNKLDENDVGNSKRSPASAPGEKSPPATAPSASPGPAAAAQDAASAKADA